MFYIIQIYNVQSFAHQMIQKSIKNNNFFGRIIVSLQKKKQNYYR